MVVERPTARQAVALAGVLVSWTMLIALFLAPSRMPPRRAAPPPWRSVASLSAMGGEGSDAAELERRWADQLLSSLEESSADEASTATLAELRSTLDSRSRLAGAASRAGGVGGSGSHNLLPGSAIRPALDVAMPKYDPSRVSDLVAAAGAVGGAAAGGGDTQSDGVPRLVRDMGSALARMEREGMELQARLAELQPSVASYNPKDVESLTKAADQVTRSPASGALPNLLRDLRAAVQEQAESKRQLSAKLELQSKLQSRAAARAASLRSLLLRRAAATDRLDVLFSDVTEGVHAAVEAASRGLNVDSGVVAPPEGAPQPEAGWEAALAELRAVVNSQLEALAASNATLTRRLEEEGALRAAAEAAAAAGSAAPGGSVPMGGQVSVGLSGDHLGGAADGVGGELGDGTDAEATSASSGAALPPPATGVVPGGSGGVVAEAVAVPVGFGTACEGKACPEGYNLAVQGATCVCRLNSGTGGGAS